MRINWVKNNQNQDWFDLLKLNLNAPYFNHLYGVYIIWYVAPSGSKVIKISSGYIGEKLKSDKLNPEIQRYSYLGQLKVTWSIVNPNYINGIVAFLSDSYNPILGETFPPETRRIEVNLIGN